MLVAKAADTILAPAIGAAARVIVREIRPGIAIGAVILAHCPPLAIADIGTPAPPRRAEPGFLQPAAFFGLRTAVGVSAALSYHCSRQSCRRGDNSRCLTNSWPQSCAAGRRRSSSRGCPKHAGVDSAAFRTQVVLVLH